MRRFAVRWFASASGGDEMVVVAENREEAREVAVVAVTARLDRTGLILDCDVIIDEIVEVTLG